MNEYEHYRWLIQSKELSHTWNPIAIQSQQIVEKLLKYILEEILVEEDNTELLRSHKLRTLESTIESQLGDCVMSKDDARFLTDFYFDARYPGDDFILVTYEDVNRCIDIVSKVIDRIKDIRCSLGGSLEEIGREILDNSDK